VAGQRIGYVRVSPLDQRETPTQGQILDQVFTDKASGRDTSRPELTGCCGSPVTGTQSSCTPWTGSPRNLDDMRALVQGLTRKGVRVEFVKESLVFTWEDSPMANFMLSVMGAFAEFERSQIRERQREAIALAKQRGAYPGNHASFTEGQLSAFELHLYLKNAERRRGAGISGHVGFQLLRAGGSFR
jgi:DNA invertase Pin-like site-specific DNA recombinase